ncbi:MAG: hypothetical protein O7J95_16420 [Planctomycetota bacterium]|nr:hypothetical protein [Planctomycetota bacterium]
MPRIRRTNLAPALFQHLLTRIQERRIASDGLEELAAWLDTEPEVPEEKWYKRLPGLTVCGEADLVKILLLPEQLPSGTEVE